MEWYQNFGPPNFQFWERLSVSPVVETSTAHLILNAANGKIRGLASAQGDHLLADSSPRTEIEKNKIKGEGRKGETREGGGN